MNGETYRYRHCATFVKLEQPKKKLLIKAREGGGNDNELDSQQDFNWQRLLQTIFGQGI